MRRVWIVAAARGHLSELRVQPSQGLQVLQQVRSRPAEAAGRIDYSQPHSYTPKHLAEKILTARSSIEGERKLVTVPSGWALGLSTRRGPWWIRFADSTLPL